MKKLIKDLIKARQYTERRKEKRKMKKLHAFEGWFVEATEGFAGTEIDLHGFKTVAEYVEAYFDGVECYISLYMRVHSFRRPCGNKIKFNLRLQYIKYKYKSQLIKYIRSFKIRGFYVFTIKVKRDIIDVVVKFHQL